MAHFSQIFLCVLLQKLKVQALEADVYSARERARLSSPELEAAQRLVAVARQRVADLESKQASLQNLEQQLRAVEFG